MNKICKRCFYEWKSKLEKPISCPKCKRYDWDEDKQAMIMTNIKKDNSK